jgi:hypothetical protein
MSDSLNNFFEKLGDKLSFGNKIRRAKAPYGSTLHSGAYFGPGENPGPNEVNRTRVTNLVENPNPSPGQVSPAVGLRDEKHMFGLNRSYPAGFTPLSYYRNYKINSDEGQPEFIIIPNGNFPLKPNDKFESNTSTWNKGTSIGGFNPENMERDGVGGFDDPTQYDFKYGLQNYDNWPNGSIPLQSTTGKNDYESFDGSTDNDPNTFNRSSVAWSSGTPHENEDPVYFGFEIIIDKLRSPLLNGELDRFLSDIGGTHNTEISSRTDISESFKIELSKFFKFNEDPIEVTNLFSTSLKKKHYIKRISGLEKLIESNESNRSKSFIDYKNDLVRISFYEDTLLSTGTLAALYKLLYWSRVRGKGIVPENLLKFDCEVIVSEVRNIGRIRKAADSNSSQYALEVLKENVSRYVYNLYECQFHFSKMSHPDQVDLENISPSPNLDIDMSFKFSDMRFERFKFDGEYGKYQSISNRKLNPLQTLPEESNSNVENIEGSLVITKMSEIPVRISPLIDILSDPNDVASVSSPDQVITQSRKNFKRKAIDKIKEALTKSSKKLLESVKKATLNETQRQLNNQFRLLNNSIDQVRNAFGIGRMSEPTNVYRNVPGGAFFFDVRNSFRNFAGDFLGGLL